MVKAFNSFKLETGNKFTTYAFYVMQSEILKTLRKKDPMRFAISLDEPFENGDGDQQNTTLLDMLPDTGDAIEDIIEEKSFIEFILNEGKEFLSDKEYFVVTSYLKNDGKMHQRRLGEEMGVSQACVSRLFARSLEKIRTALDGRAISRLKQKEKGIEMMNTNKKVQKSTSKSMAEALREGAIEIANNGIKKPTLKEVAEILEKGAMETTNEKIIEIPKGTLFEKVSTLYKDHPELTAHEMSDLLECNTASVRSYISQIKNGAQSPTEYYAAKAKQKPQTKQTIVTTQENITAFPSLVTLSMENSSSQSIQAILSSIANMLQENENYTLNIDVSKQAQ